MLIGGPGNDTLDGGPGDNVVIDSLGADTVTSATAAGKDWLTTHARTVNGKTVLDVGGKERTLPRADLSQLVRDASLRAEFHELRPAPEPHVRFWRRPV